MGEITKRTKRLVAELSVLVCIVCVWVVKSETFDIDDVKAGVLKQVVKADSDNIDAYRFLAGYYMDSGSYEEAVEVLRQVVKIDPNDAYAHSMLGDAYWNCGRYEEAMAAYKQAMILHVDNPHIHYQIAQAYLKMGDKDSALEEYEILKSLDKKLADELLGLIHE
jgi:cytochrome c-type biogenesis protein CcmH/NrfG